MISLERIEHLGLAFRKAKVDLYYSTHSDLELIADYEDALNQNLRELYTLINGDNEEWVKHREFVGSWMLVPKAIKLPQEKEEDHSDSLYFSSPSDKWKNRFHQTSGVEKPTAEFRLMSKCSMNFHILSSLWMIEVGHLFDQKLTVCAYGNRLRRSTDGQEINELSLGSFEPYLKPFRDWRDTGIDTIRDALDAEKNVVAVTADVNSFYHELDASFMLSTRFTEKILGVQLDEWQTKLNRLFVSALKAWADATPLKKGLPVGLPASAVIANVALFELDRAMETEVVPLYYGRYVDDIMLVMEKGANFQSSSDVWEWLFHKSRGLLKWGGEKNRDVTYCPPYLEVLNCRVCFSNSKNKIFLLSGDEGRALLGSIAQQIQERASEWRSMPHIPRSASDVGANLLSAAQLTGEATDGLRTVDSLAIRRAEFAMRLRDMEAFERDLLPDSWREHREAFLGAFIQHVLVLPQFFDLAIYLPRVVALATSCEDFDLLKKMLITIDQICDLIASTCEISIKACPDVSAVTDQISVVFGWPQQLKESFWSSVKAAFPSQLSRRAEKKWIELFQSEPNLTVQDMKTAQQRLFSYDLAHMPFRFASLPNEVLAIRSLPVVENIHPIEDTLPFLPSSVIDGLTILSTKWLKFEAIPNGFLFATRPFSLAELSLLRRELYSGEELEDLNKVVLSLRGFTVTDRMPYFDDEGVLQVSDSSLTMKCRIGVSSWKTSIDSWVKAVVNKTGDDFDRYTRLNNFIDHLLSEPSDCRYLILPELSLPANWFLRIARKLHGRRISLLSGVEYLHAGKGIVRNQVWAALSHDGLGFPSFMIYRQDKQRPAFHEEQELQRIAGLRLSPETEWETPPIIQHGKFRFAILVCSELTNISHRAELSGNIDALFVPEWNQDTETFNALVESAALDLPAYIIQCNDRQYGDSRIRAPYKDNWKRDLLRVKGGVSDYCVIGEIDVESLRQFQSSHRSPNLPYKPVPDGFEISPSRKTLPKAE
ncbi:RNA-directed DNA polymerase [Neptunicoccus cionae]|uniref:RNA-directed DNA polymerase n=1 Tax=Neptunicoccus cionae TaxID=2035344 RepID=UPI000C792FFA|nr:RNA-directed DNA polymerase [Amylibacter cionae]PLS23574.1 Reverse transcriptase [Amylibacter cionae]